MDRELYHDAVSSRTAICIADQRDTELPMNPPNCLQINMFSKFFIFLSDTNILLISACSFPDSDSCNRSSSDVTSNFSLNDSAISL